MIPLSDFGTPAEQDRPPNRTARQAVGGPVLADDVLLLRELIRSDVDAGAHDPRLAVQIYVARWDDSVIAPIDAGGVPLNVQITVVEARELRIGREVSDAIGVHRQTSLVPEHVVVSVLRNTARRRPRNALVVDGVCQLASNVDTQQTWKADPPDYT